MQRRAIPDATKARVVERQQAGLDPNATCDEQLAELEDALLALVSRHEDGELRQESGMSEPLPNRGRVRLECSLLPPTSRRSCLRLTPNDKCTRGQALTRC